MNPKKLCPHVSNETSLLWCNDCAVKAAGPKPAALFSKGDFVVIGREYDIGIITKVDVHLAGQATAKPCWWESIHVNGVNADYQIDADSCTKLVPAK